MTLKGFFELIPNSQKVVLIEEDLEFKVFGSKELVQSMIREDEELFTETVAEVKARMDEMWIWIEEGK